MPPSLELTCEWLLAKSDQMPATTERFSRMITERPAALSRAAAIRPSRPAPMTTTSVCSGSGTGLRPITSRRLSKPAEPRTCAISRTMSSAAPSGDEAAPSASASKTRVSRREHDLSAARMAAVWAATSAAPLPTATSAMGASTAHLSAAAVCAACAAGGCDMSRPMMSMVEARRASAGCRCSHAAASAAAAAALDFEATRMAARKEAGALDERVELAPREVVRNGHRARRGGEAAVGRGDDARGVAHRAHEAQQPLADDLGVLDARGGGVDQAGHDDLVGAEVAALHGLLEEHDLVVVTRVGRLEHDVLGLHVGHDGPQRGSVDVVVVGAGVVAPAHVVAHLLGRHVGEAEGEVERLDVGGGDIAELLVGQVRVTRVTSHGQVGAVHLELHARSGDGLVLGCDGPREGLDVGSVVAAEDAVLAEDGEGAGRRDGPEGLRGMAARRAERVQEGLEVSYSG